MNATQPGRPAPARRDTHQLRARLLGVAFGLLYGRLAGVHELTGRVAFGAAWAGRRTELLPIGDVDGWVVDLGCGEGWLMSDPTWGGRRRLGVDPSTQASARARRRGLVVVRAMAQRLPLRGGCCGCLVCSYPGPWILDRRVWDEIARVTAPGAPVTVLLGGSIERGRGARLRGLLQRVVYGARAGDGLAALPSGFGHALIPGALEPTPDAWGVALVWRGVRGDGG